MQGSWYMIKLHNKCELLKYVPWFRVDIEVNIQNCWNGGNHYKNSQWNL